MDKYGVPLSIYKDHRFSDIGDLPTGFLPYRKQGVSKLFARPLCVQELNLIHLGMNTEVTGIQHIVRAVDMSISCDASMLTDGDFEYVITWLRARSFPKTPSLVKWQCKKTNIVKKVGRDFEEDPKYMSYGPGLLDSLGLERELCNTHNTEIVHNVNIIITSIPDEAQALPEKFDFPRIATKVQQIMYLHDHPEQEYETTIARWIAEGETLEDKMALLDTLTLEDYAQIKKFIKYYAHGTSEDLRLKCRVCGNRVSHRQRTDIMSFFADNSEKNILDMQYSLMSEFGMQPDDTMSAKKFLYMYSSLVKDKKEEEEQRKLAAAVRKNKRG